MTSLYTPALSRRQPTVIVSGNGDVWVMLHDYAATPPAYEARRATGSGWQAPGVVPLGLSPIAVDGQGDAFATTASYDLNHGGIWVSRFDRTAGWSQPETLSFGEATARLDSSPAIAVAANGTAVVAWTRTVSEPGSLISDTVVAISAAVYR
jgi:hypothetical protein